MNDEKLYEIWVYLQSEPLFWLTLTLGAYITGEKVYKSSKLFPLFNPVAISIIIISAILRLGLSLVSELLLLYEMPTKRIEFGLRALIFSLMRLKT